MLINVSTIQQMYCLETLPMEELENLVNIIHTMLQVVNFLSLLLSSYIHPEHVGTTICSINTEVGNRARPSITYFFGAEFLMNLNF
jgi:hypothetical protein